MRALSGQASTDLDAFRRIVGRRTSASSFSSATVRPEVLMDCFRLALVRSKWEFQCNHRYRNLIIAPDSACAVILQCTTLSLYCRSG